MRELIAEFDPELARPRDRLRALGREQWELKAVIDGKCRRGLEQLRNWLSQVNPAMDNGDLLQRLVADAVAKYDPARAPAPRGRQASAAVARAFGGGSRDTERRGSGDRRPEAAARRETGAAQPYQSCVAQDGRDKVAAARARHVEGKPSAQTRSPQGGRDEVDAAAARQMRGAEPGRPALRSLTERRWSRPLARKSAAAWRHRAALAPVGGARAPRRARSRRLSGGISGYGIGAGVRIATRKAVAAAARGIWCRSITFSRMRWAARAV